jgi:hypothetical protein
MKVMKSFAMMALDALSKLPVYTLCTRWYTLKHDKFFPWKKPVREKHPSEGSGRAKPRRWPRRFAKTVHTASHWFTIKNLFKNFARPEMLTPAPPV